MLGLRSVHGQQQAPGIGGDSTHCRTGTCGITWSTRYAAVCDIRRAQHEGPAAFAADGQQLVVTALAATQPQEPVGQDATLEEGVELVFDEPGQLGPGAGFGVSDEAGRVLLYQAVRRGLLLAVALLVDRRAIDRPVRLPTPWTARVAPEVVTFYGLKPRTALQSLQPALDPATAIAGFLLDQTPVPPGISRG